MRNRTQRGFGKAHQLRRRNATQQRQDETHPPELMDFTAKTKWQPWVSTVFPLGGPRGLWDLDRYLQNKQSSLLKNNIVCAYASIITAKLPEQHGPYSCLISLGHIRNISLLTVRRLDPVRPARSVLVIHLKPPGTETQNNFNDNYILYRRFSFFFFFFFRPNFYMGAKPQLLFSLIQLVGLLIFDYTWRVTWALRGYHVRKMEIFQ